MKRYGILHAPFMAFGSGAFYQDVARHWSGLGLGYLFLLLAVCWIPGMVRLYMGVTAFVTNDAPRVVEQIPAITIANGEASIEEPQPYRIINPDDGKTLAVIDTTGGTTTLEEVDARLLVTRHDVIARKNEFETRTFNLREIEDFTLDRQMITHWLNLVRLWIVPITYPFALIGSFIGRIVLALFYSLAGLLFCGACNNKLPYGALLRLTMVTMTPVIILKTILPCTGMHIPGSWFWYFLLGMVYLFFAVKSVGRTADGGLEAAASTAGSEGQAAGAAFPSPSEGRDGELS